MRVIARVESREEERSLEGVGKVRVVMGEEWCRREPSSLERGGGIGGGGASF